MCSVMCKSSFSLVSPTQGTKSTYRELLDYLCSNYKNSQGSCRVSPFPPMLNVIFRLVSVQGNLNFNQIFQPRHSLPTSRTSIVYVMRIMCENPDRGFNLLAVSNLASTFRCIVFLKTVGNAVKIHDMFSKSTSAQYVSMPACLERFPFTWNFR